MREWGKCELSSKLEEGDSGRGMPTLRSEVTMSRKVEEQIKLRGVLDTIAKYPTMCVIPSTSHFKNLSRSLAVREHV